MSFVCVPTETETRREHQHRIWLTAHNSIVLRREIAGIKFFVCRWAVDVVWDVETHAIGKLQQRVQVPFVLNIKAYLSAFKGCFPLSCACNVRICVVPSKLASLIFHKGRDAAYFFAAVRISSCKGLHKRVLHVVQLVMRTKGDVVVAQIPREVVFKHPDILF